VNFNAAAFTYVGVGLWRYDGECGLVNVFNGYAECLCCPYAVKPSFYVYYVFVVAVGVLSAFKVWCRFKPHAAVVFVNTELV
ncbi:MAG: hypothetical protein RL497_1432, partial [Pseudomonadota bacterium]